MATRINLTQVASFNVHVESNLAQRWTKWKQSFEFYLSEFCTDDDSQVRALLLNCAGPDVQERHVRHLRDMYFVKPFK